MSKQKKAMKIVNTYEKPITVYLAQPMSGRTWEEIVAEAKVAKALFKNRGIDVWSPTLSEYNNQQGVVNTKTTKKELKAHWDRDMAAMGRCDALVSINGDMGSEGVGYEIALAQHWYAMPVVVMKRYRATPHRISHLAAKVVRTLDDAADYLKKYFAL